MLTLPKCVTHKPECLSFSHSDAFSTEVSLCRLVFVTVFIANSQCDPKPRGFVSVVMAPTNMKPSLFQWYFIYKIEAVSEYIICI